MTSMAPKDWTHWLAIVMAVYNNHRNKTTSLLSNQILLRYKLSLAPLEKIPSNNEAANNYVTIIMKKCKQAIQAINQAV
jgi:hypothetical protein